VSDRSAIVVLRQQLESPSTPSAPPAAWKVAVNFAAFQRRLGLTHSLAAPIDSLSIHASGAELPSAAARLLHVEAEIALRLGIDLDASSTEDTVRASIESYAPCLELVDYALPRSGLPALFAHSFFHAGVVLGPSVARDAFVTLPRDLPSASDGRGTLHPRVADTVPDDLAHALQSVLERALEAGTQLYRGQLLLCGSYIEPLPLAPGARVKVDYGPTHGHLTIARSAT
jgi:2-keto-4-pentenoate hydratase